MKLIKHCVWSLPHCPCLRVTEWHVGVFTQTLINKTNKSQILSTQSSNFSRNAFLHCTLFQICFTLVTNFFLTQMYLNPPKMQCKVNCLFLNVNLDCVQCVSYNLNDLIGHFMVVRHGKSRTTTINVLTAAEINLWRNAGLLVN